MKQKVVLSVAYLIKIHSEGVSNKGHVPILKAGV